MSQNMRLFWLSKELTCKDHRLTLTWQLHVHRSELDGGPWMCGHGNFRCPFYTTELGWNSGHIIQSNMKTRSALKSMQWCHASEATGLSRNFVALLMCIGRPTRATLIPTWSMEVNEPYAMQSRHKAVDFGQAVPPCKDYPQIKSLLSILTNSTT